RQRFGFATISTRPNGTDCVNDEFRRQVVAARDFRFARPTTAERSTFLQQLWTGRAVNRAIHSAAAEQRCVCGVYDRIDLELRDIAADDLDPAHGARRSIRQEPSF